MLKDFGRFMGKGRPEPKVKNTGLFIAGRDNTNKIAAPKKPMTGMMKSLKSATNG